MLSIVMNKKMGQIGVISVNYGLTRTIKNRGERKNF